MFKICKDKTNNNNPNESQKNENNIIDDIKKAHIK